MPAENIYQMFARHGRAGFFVKRDSWTHPQTAAQIVSVGGMEAGLLPGDPPYYKNPVVIADVTYQGRIKREKLSSAGTYAYTEIGRPEWWPLP
jgi:hypothetical protein